MSSQKFRGGEVSTKLPDDEEAHFVGATYPNRIKQRRKENYG